MQKSNFRALGSFFFFFYLSLTVLNLVRAESSDESSTAENQDENWTSTFLALQKDMQAHSEKFRQKDQKKVEDFENQRNVNHPPQYFTAQDRIQIANIVGDLLEIFKLEDGTQIPDLKVEINSLHKTLSLIKNKMMAATLTTTNSTQEIPDLFVRKHPCDSGSCYPNTGNLLINRESSLSASSTCGLQGEERYCIVSPLDIRKKCFRCDSTPKYARNPLLSHKVENILHRFSPGSQQRSWWQSKGGEENVNIQLDLEAEFHFTHLIITFKTFRPAAMLIERSSDFGKTWKVYRYFADNCDKSFPGISKGPATAITDVTCESRYSSKFPSTEGEVIFRVLPRSLPFNDPYSPEVQNLLKVTNMRINFTKLHTLDNDTLLDKRADIQEKYYYAIYEMVVRGSCSCHGHALRCLPLPNVHVRPDLAHQTVHGMCECAHNTAGVNCEQCADFYHDLPWKPAYAKQSNACKRCNCNNHADSCHFDAAVFEASGNVSGGVCDNCKDHTTGQNCGECKPGYYLRPDRVISDADACQPCDCDPRGTLDGGMCDSKSDVEKNLEAGQCQCKPNVTGRRCDIFQQ